MVHEPSALEGRQRLQKVMAHAGLASRRVCEDLIADGLVKINDKVAELGDRAEIGVDEITVDGVVLNVDPSRVTFLLNKPVGVISTVADTHDRTTVVDLLETDERVFPVGRLDADSEGLLLLTNDGGLTQRLTHPSFGVDKEYLVDVHGSPSRGTLRQLREGIDLEEGRTAPAKVSELSPGLLRFVLHEGKNRQIRRMCDSVGHPVQRLVRTRIGPLSDSSLGPGQSRLVTPEEIRSLEQAVAAANGPR